MNLRGGRYVDDWRPICWEVGEKAVNEANKPASWEANHDLPEKLVLIPPSEVTARPTQRNVGQRDRIEDEVSVILDMLRAVLPNPPSALLGANHALQAQCHFTA